MVPDNRNYAVRDTKHETKARTKILKISRLSTSIHMARITTKTYNSWSGDRWWDHQHPYCCNGEYIFATKH